MRNSSKPTAADVQEQVQVDRAVRAATLIRSRRSVVPRAFADARLARAPAARSRLQAMVAQVSHAALAANESTYGRCASGPSGTSAGRSQDVVVRIHPVCVMRADLAGAIIGGSAAAGTERR